MAKKKSEAKKEATKSSELYDKYEVVLQFRDRVYGGLPKSKQLIDAYVQSKFGEENADLAEKIKEEVSIAEETEKVSCGFKENSTGPYLSDYQFKAMLREAAVMLKITKNKRGARQVFQHGIFIKPPHISMGKKKVDGEEEFVGHVLTPRGKRSILKRADYMQQPKITFEIWMLKDHIVTADDLEKCLTLGQELGMGSCRSFEKGKFDLVKFVQL